MSDGNGNGRDPDDVGSVGSAGSVGSVGEEAAKLLGALGSLGTLGGEWAKDLGEHVDTGAPECTYCPLCRTVHVIRETSPEVRAHLATAAASLMQAAAGLLSSVSQEPGRAAEPSVERIDLDDAGSADWPEDLS